MSRRKQHKPMQITSDGQGETNNATMNQTKKCSNSCNGAIEVNGDANVDMTRAHCHAITATTPSANAKSLSSTAKSALDKDRSEVSNETHTSPPVSRYDSVAADSTCDRLQDVEELLRNKIRAAGLEPLLSQLSATQSRRGSRTRGRGRGRGRGGRAPQFSPLSLIQFYDTSLVDIETQMEMENELMKVSNRNGTSEKAVMKCRICFKPFKRPWSLQVHELLHHGSQEVLPENLALTLSLTASIKRKMGLNTDEGSAKQMKTSSNCEMGRRKRRANANMSPKALQQLFDTNVHQEDNHRIYEQTNVTAASPLLGNSDIEENNNDTTSQSSETGSLSFDGHFSEGLAPLQHTPMFGGITVPGLGSLRELRHQMSLARRTCKFCGKVCFKPSDLQRHLMKHTGERPFSCSQCGRKFKAKRSLLYHQRASHGAVVELSPALEDKFAQTKKYQKMLLQGLPHHQTGPPEVVTDHSSVDSNPASAVEDRKLKVDDLPPVQPIASKAGSDLTADNEDLSSGLSDTDNDSDNDDEADNVEDGEGVNDDGASSHSEKTENLLRNEVSEQRQIELNATIDDDENHVPSSEKLNADVSALIPAVPTEPEDNFSVDDGTSNILTIASDKGDHDRVPTVTRYKINTRTEEVIATRVEGIKCVTGEKVYLYKCHLCGKVFSVMSKLQNHLTVHLKRHKKQYSCVKCGEVFRLRSQWVLHSRTHKGEQPKPLSSSPLQVNDVNGSLDAPSVSPVLLPPHLHHNGQSSYSSEDGPLSLVTKAENTSMVGEIVRRHNTSSPPAINTQETSTVNTSLPSPESDLLYSYDFKSKFKHNYTCSYCGKYFDRPFSLQRHERMHTGVKPCYCKDCGRGFSEPRNLRHHIIRFHSDGSLHHLLRRNRCKEDGFPGSQDNGRLLAFARNSLLKKSVEHFLNSSLPNLPKLDDDDDDVPPTLEEMVPLIPQLDEGCEAQHQPNQTTANQSVDLLISEAPKLVQEEMSEEGEHVTVVIPTEVADDNSNKVVPFTMPDFWNSFNGEQKKILLPSIDHKEILTDPKRSLMGNRRKHRPHKLTSSPMVSPTPSLQHDASSSPEPTPIDMSKNRALSPLPQYNTSMDEVLVKQEPGVFSLAMQNDSQSETNSKWTRHERWQTNMTVASLLAKERGLDMPPQRSRSRGRNTFFSSYSPRLDVVLRPVVRGQVCKPKVLGDGKMQYSCCYCNKMFCSGCDLNRHMDFHEGSCWLNENDVRPFKCKYCQYSSRTNSQLKVHLMRHRGIKQFRCPTCNYTGVTQSDLNRHCKTQAHFLRQMNSCDSCGLGFFSHHQCMNHQANCNKAENRNAEAGEDRLVLMYDEDTVWDRRMLKRECDNEVPSNWDDSAPLNLTTYVAGR